MQNEKESLQKIWDSLSDYEKEILDAIGTVPIMRESMEQMFGKKVTVELEEKGILKTTSYVAELKATVERLKPDHDLLAPDAVWTEEDKQYSRAVNNLRTYVRAYERDRSTDPKIREWGEPSLLKVKAEYGTFIKNKSINE